MHTFIHTHTHLRIPTQKYSHAYIKVWMNAHLCIFTNVYGYRCICTCICMCVCASDCMCVFKCPVKGKSQEKRVTDTPAWMNECQKVMPNGEETKSEKKKNAASVWSDWLAEWMNECIHHPAIGMYTQMSGTHTHMCVSTCSCSGIQFKILSCVYAPLAASRVIIQSWCFCYCYRCCCCIAAVVIRNAHRLLSITRLWTQQTKMADIRYVSST